MKKNIKTFIMISKKFNLPQDITIYITNIYCENNYKNIKDCIIDNFYYPIQHNIIKNNCFEFNDLILTCYQGNIKILDYLLNNIFDFELWLYDASINKFNIKNILANC
jgi:hypothetical protein